MTSMIQPALTQETPGGPTTRCTGLQPHLVAALACLFALILSFAYLLALTIISLCSKNVQQCKSASERACAAFPHAWTAHVCPCQVD